MSVHISCCTAPDVHDGSVEQVMSYVQRLIRDARYGPPVVVVSGLPRSGTSLMMQMLEAGGVEPVTDGLRQADESNPKGYYELEQVKQLEKGEDLSWLRDARGKAVKIIAFLLRYLPPTFNYKVVFMDRALDEVLASQAKMLASRGEPAGSEAGDMAEIFAAHLAQTARLLERQACFRVLHVNYRDLVADCEHEAQRVNAFLGGKLDVGRMVKAVDPTLYRNRAEL